MHLTTEPHPWPLCLGSGLSPMFFILVPILFIGSRAVNLQHTQEDPPEYYRNTGKGKMNANRERMANVQCALVGVEVGLFYITAACTPFSIRLQQVNVMGEAGRELVAVQAAQGQSCHLRCGKNGSAC